MEFEEPEPLGPLIQEAHGELLVTIRPKVSFRKQFQLYISTLFLVLMVGFLSYHLLLSDEAQLTKTDIPIIAYFVFGWNFVALGVIQFVAYLWTFAGVEEIKFGNGIMRIRRTALTRFYSKEYQIDQLQSIFVPAQSSQPGSIRQYLGTMGIPVGRILGKFGRKTVRFAASTTEAEGRKILQSAISAGHISLDQLRDNFLGS